MISWSVRQTICLRNIIKKKSSARIDTFYTFYPYFYTFRVCFSFPLTNPVFRAIIALLLMETGESPVRARRREAQHSQALSQSRFWGNAIGEIREGG